MLPLQDIFHTLQKRHRLRYLGNWVNCSFWNAYAWMVHALCCCFFSLKVGRCHGKLQALIWKRSTVHTPRETSLTVTYLFMVQSWFRSVQVQVQADCVHAAGHPCSSFTLWCCTAICPHHNLLKQIRTLLVLELHWPVQWPMQWWLAYAIDEALGREFGVPSAPSCRVVLRRWQVVFILSAQTVSTHHIVQQ